MKKFIHVIVTVLILSLCLGVTSLATGTTDVADDSATTRPVMTFSEDFQIMYYDGYEYHQKDLRLFETGYSDEYENSDFYIDDFDGFVSVVDYYDFSNADYELTNTQKESVESIQVDMFYTFSDISVTLEITYKNGTYLTVSYLREDYVDDYEKFLNGDFSEIEINFLWPVENVIKTNKNLLMTGNTKEVSNEDFWYNSMDFAVYVATDDGALSYEIGQIVEITGTYYYLDYNENNLKIGTDYWYDKGLVSGTVILREITDEALIAEIDVAMEAYYQDDFGYFYNDELANAVSYFFLILLFGVVPGIVFLVTFIFAFIKKGKYRKLLFTASFFTLAEIITFIAFMIVASIK